MGGRVAPRTKQCLECQSSRQRVSFSRTGWERTKCCRRCALKRLRASQKMLLKVTPYMRRVAAQTRWYSQSVWRGKLPARMPKTIVLVKMTSRTQAAFHHGRVPSPQLVTVRFCLHRLRLHRLPRGTLIVAVAASRASMETRFRKLAHHYKSWPRLHVLGASLLAGQLRTWLFQNRHPRRGDGRVYKVRKGCVVKKGAEPKASQLVRADTRHSYRGASMCRTIAAARGTTEAAV